MENRRNSRKIEAKSSGYRHSRHGTPLYKLKNIFEKNNLRPILAFLAIIVAAAAFIVMTSITKPVVVENTALFNKSYIVVGVVTGELSAVDSSGEISGLEKDVVDTLIDSVYGADKEREYTVINAQEASYKLRNNEIDLAIGQLCSGTSKTSGLALSTGYYTDNVYAYVSDSSKYMEFSSLDGQRVLIMDTEIGDDDFTKMVENAEMNTEVIGCSSYADGEESVKNGNAAALINSELKSKGISLNRIPQALYTVDYKIAAYTSNKDTIELFNKKLSEMKSDGSLKSIYDKYGIVYSIDNEEIS